MGNAPLSTPSKGDIYNQFYFDSDDFSSGIYIASLISGIFRWNAILSYCKCEPPVKALIWPNPRFPDNPTFVPPSNLISNLLPPSPPPPIGWGAVSPELVLAHVSRHIYGPAQPSHSSSHNQTPSPCQPHIYWLPGDQPLHSDTAKHLDLWQCVLPN